VAVWLSAINVAKAAIARVIITIHRAGANAAISNTSVLLALAIGFGMKVRGFHWPAYLAPLQLRRPVMDGERSDKSRPNVYKLSIESRK
jgi:hypothetical protein